MIGGNKMNCNNKYCMWQAFLQCCNVDDDIKKATPNELDCPISLRADFNVQLLLLLAECRGLLSKCNFETLLKLKKIIKVFSENE